METPIDRYASANGIRIHLLDHLGGEPPIVLLPGITANLHNFDGLIDAGLAPRFRVVGLDLRGRGLSDKPAQGYSIAEHAADVIGVLDALGLDRVVLGGHSFGALLTAYIAARQPERVSHTILIDIALTPADPRVGEAIRPSLERLAVRSRPSRRTSSRFRRRRTCKGGGIRSSRPTTAPTSRRARTAR